MTIRFINSYLTPPNMPFAIKGTLDDLPVFKEFPKDGMIVEIAEITSKRVPHATHHYRLQEHGGVLGRDPSCQVIYLSRRTIEREDGAYAFPGEIVGISVKDVATYVIPWDHAVRSLSSKESQANSPAADKKQDAFNECYF
jgi:hypothetical protein